MREIFAEQHRLGAVSIIQNCDRLYDEYVAARDRYNAAVKTLYHMGEHHA